MFFNDDFSLKLSKPYSEPGRRASILFTTRRERLPKTPLWRWRGCPGYDRHTLGEGNGPVDGQSALRNTHRNEQFFRACCCRLPFVTGGVSCIRINKSSSSRPKSCAT